MTTSDAAGGARPVGRTTYLYTLSDPRDGRIRYVGKTVNVADRLYMHLYNATHGRDTHKDRWIRTLLAAGVEPLLTVVDEVQGEVWKESEIYWIDTLRAEGYDLTNVTAGGCGVIAPRTEAWRKKIGDAHRGKSMSADVREYYSKLYKARADERGCKRGHPWTEENTAYGVTRGRRYRYCTICSKASQRSWRRKTGSAKGRAKPRCKRGHPLDGENLRVLVRTRDGKTYEERICRACVRLRNKEYKRRTREQRREKH